MGTAVYPSNQPQGDLSRSESAERKKPHTVGPEDRQHRFWDDGKTRKEKKNKLTSRNTTIYFSGRVGKMQTPLEPVVPTFSPQKKEEQNPTLNRAITAFGGIGSFKTKGDRGGQPPLKKRRPHRGTPPNISWRKKDRKKTQISPPPKVQFN